jgi:hypothetical protein
VARQWHIDVDFEENETKIWTWRRFGQTCDELPDGRRIYIGGEHEDWYVAASHAFCFPDRAHTYLRYDPMFFIFNDVVVYDPQSQSYDLYRYPVNIFPPTDFHTATLLGDSIWIIGGLGYSKDRGNVTPVYRLDVNTLTINN